MRGTVAVYNFWRGYGLRQFVVSVRHDGDKLIALFRSKRRLEYVYTNVLINQSGEKLRCFRFFPYPRFYARQWQSRTLACTLLDIWGRYSIFLMNSCISRLLECPGSREQCKRCRKRSRSVSGRFRGMHHLTGNTNQHSVTIDVENGFWFSDQSKRSTIRPGVLMHSYGIGRYSHLRFILVCDPCEYVYFRNKKDDGGLWLFDDFLVGLFRRRYTRGRIWEYREDRYLAIEWCKVLSANL